MQKRGRMAATPPPVKRRRIGRPTKLATDIKAFAERLRVPEGDKVGQHLWLMPFQVGFIDDAFKGGVRRAILSIARRNTKTATVAIIVLAALIGPLRVPNSLILSAARSRQQASVVFEYVAKMIRLSGLGSHFKITDSTKQIFCPAFGTTYRAIAAEATTALGYGARLVIHDELGAVTGNRDPLYEALASSMGSYSDSLELIISTQAADDADLLSILIDDALAGTDAGVICHLYTAPIDCELDDASAWAAANPAMAYGVRDRADLERMAAEAQRLPSREASFRNFILNQRVRAVEHYIPPGLWDACNGEVDEAVLHSGPVYAGLDLSSRNDLTALALVACDDAGRWHSKIYAWTPEATLIERSRTDRVAYDAWVKQGHMETMPGSMIDYAALAVRLSEICAEYPVTVLAFDRWRMSILKTELERIGAVLPLVETGQGYKDATTSVEALEAAVLNDQLRHGGNPLLRWSMANVAIDRDAAGNRKFSKKLRTRRIDPAVALAMAMRAATMPTGVATVDSLIA